MLQNPQLHYLDNAATTIVAPEVADVIDKAMREHWANPSSLYGPGARSEEALNAARAAVARTLGCKSRELYFTSCGSESNNLALLGAVQHPHLRQGHRGIRLRAPQCAAAAGASGKAGLRRYRGQLPGQTARWTLTPCWSGWTRTLSLWPV